MTPAARPDVKQDEREFWDRQAEAAAQRDDADAALAALPDEVQDPAYRFYLLALGELEGRRVLDCGCGEGKLSVLLASAGATVEAFDISPASVEQCRRRAAAWGVTDRLQVRVADIEDLDHPDAAFDIVCGTFVLHHVDCALAGRSIRRVLRPGGRAVFLENSDANPILMLGRRRLVGRFGIPRMGSPDEHPLSRSQIMSLEPYFGESTRYYPQMIFFRLAFYRLVQSVLPTERFPRGPLRRLGDWLWRAGPRLDDALYRLAPSLRRYSWWQVLVLEEPRVTGNTQP